MPLTRTCYLADRTRFALTIESDASPWGGGAVLWHGEPHLRRNRLAAAWMSCEWAAADETLLGCVIGQPNDQARWEAFMILLAIRQWVVVGLRGRITVIGDAEGVLSAITRLKSNDPVINDMAKEAALILAPKGLSLEALHVWGEENCTADALSRRHLGYVFPGSLYGVPENVVLDRGPSTWFFLGKRARASE